MTEGNTNAETLFCDYYEQWISVYKEGAIREVTMKKYRLTQAWLGRLIPDLKLADMDRVNYQKLINGYAEHHERRNRSAEAPYKTAAQRNIQASYHHLPFPELLPIV